MAQNSGSHPMKPGTTVGDIKTPMNSTNVGKQNSPGTHKFAGMPSASGGTSIKGLGEKIAWKKS